MSEIVATFDPFRNHLDLPETLKVLETCLDGAEDGELFLEQTKSETLLFDDGTLKNLISILLRALVLEPSTVNQLVMRTPQNSLGKH